MKTQTKAAKCKLQYQGRNSEGQDHGTTAKQQVLNQTLMSMTETSMDVVEVCSPERVTKVAESMGLNAGWSLDLTTSDENGRPWDFDCVHMRNKAARM